MSNSKAAELLRALNSQIQHKSTPNSLPIIQQPSKNITSAEQTQPPTSQLIGEIIEDKMPKTIFNQKMKYEENKQAPQCLTQILDKQIGTLVSQHLCENIQSILRQRQKNGYDSFTKGDNVYLQILVDNVKKRQNAHMDVVDSLMFARLNKVQADLEKGKLMVHSERKIKNRRQLQKIQKLDLARMIKIKDGQLRSKMDILHDKMQNFDHIDSEDQEQNQAQSQLHRKVLQNIDASVYSLNSQRTKIAKDYVRHMHQQRKSFERRRKQRQAKYQKQELQRQNQLKEAAEMRDLSKHQQILQKIQARRQKRLEEQKQEDEKQQLARKLLSQYHRKIPIFKKKQKEFEQKIIKPQQKFRQQKLREIRQQRKAMSLSDMKLHQKKYLDKLQIEKSKRVQEFKLIMKSRNSHDKNRIYYKGSAHARIQKMTKQDVLREQQLRQASKLKAHRMKQYSQIIHKKHLPTVDQQKKQQLLKFIQEDLLKKRQARKMFKQVVDPQTQQIRFEEYYEQLPKKDWKIEGNKFFEESKKIMKKKEPVTAIQKIEELQKNSKQNKEQNVKLLQSEVQPKKQRHLWEIRTKQLQQIANSQIINANNFEYVKHNIENLDNKAAQKEQLISHLELSMEDRLKQKDQLDNFYLQSIKEKIKLLE